MKYYTLSKPSNGTYKESGSIFTCYLRLIASLEEFQSALRAIKEEHPKASHYCYAYRIKNGEDTIEFSSDAGEPSGSAGLPILNTLRSSEMINVLAVVIRYYGGSKLGIPGLIHAYKTATVEAIQANELIEYVELIRYKLTAFFQDVGLAYRLINSVPITVVEKSTSDQHEWILTLPTSQSDLLTSVAEQFHTLSLEKL